MTRGTKNTLLRKEKNSFMNMLVEVSRTAVVNLARSIRHPRTPLINYHCGTCGVPLRGFSQCPECGADTEHSPRAETMSPIPWWATGIALVVGIATICLGNGTGIGELKEIGRFLAYGSVGNITGMSMRWNSQKKGD